MSTSRVVGRSDAVLAIDQGTGSTKALLVGRDGAILGRASVPITRHDPQPGWVEQNAGEIRDSVIEAIATVIEGANTTIDSIGLSNQRESAVIWSTGSGQPLGPMLGWQDRRTASRAAVMARRGEGDRVRRSTGLPLDPMFSALKFQWLLDQVDPSRELARSGRISVGTVDSWILACLTGEHRIEAGNASRTQLLNLRTLTWDEELLELFNIPKACLPRIAASNEASMPVRGVPGLPEGLRIRGVLGDSHAALYAHGVRDVGQVKATYGTGGSVMGLAPRHSSDSDAAGLVRTIAWATPEPVYAFEGTVLSLGSTLVWLADLLGTDPAHLAQIARDGRPGVDLVPAFAGLGAPYWDDGAQSMILGFGLGTRASDLALSAFESIALQTEALLAAAEEGLGIDIDTMLVDGGPTKNDWLMQLQADLSQRTVVRSNVTELSAIGAAHLAGVTSGFWTASECARLPRDRSPFGPDLVPELAADRRSRWDAAIARSRFTPQQ